MHQLIENAVRYGLITEDDVPLYVRMMRRDPVNTRRLIRMLERTIR